MLYCPVVIFPLYMSRSNHGTKLAILGFVLIIFLFFIVLLQNQRLERYEHALQGAGQQRPIQDAASVFVSQFPADQYAALKREDRPSFGDVRNAAFYKGSVYLATLGSVVKFDAATGKILAFSNPALLPQPKHVAIQNDTLFVASGFEGAGVFQINLATGHIEAQYNETTGLGNTQNLEVYNDGTYIWVGTFRGVGRIDPKTHYVKFYSTAAELNSPCDWNGVNLHVRGTDVWAQVIAHATCSGAALHYNRTNGAWTQYNTATFAPMKNRIDFTHFIVSDIGVFAHYQIEFPGNITQQIKKFNPETGTWALIGSGTYNDQKSLALLSEKLPPEATYRDTIITQNENDQFTIKVKSDTSWITFPFNAAEISLQSITKNPIADNYLVMTPAGLGIMGPKDVAPHIVVSTRAVTYSTDDDLSFTADKKMLVVYNTYLSEMGGGDALHQFLVYDQTAQTGFGFTLPMGNLEEYQPLAANTLVQNGAKLILSNGHGTFEIDLTTKTVKLLK